MTLNCPSFRIPDEHRNQYNKLIMQITSIVVNNFVDDMRCICRDIGSGVFSAFVRMNRRPIAMMFVHLSIGIAVRLGRACIEIIRW